MSRFYFDLSNGDGDTPDETGSEMESIAEVEREVGRILGDVVREVILSERTGTIGVSVRDDGGTPCFSGKLQFSMEQLR